MTTLQIYTDDKIKIADENSFKNIKQNEISTRIDQQIKNTKVKNTKKAQHFISAIEKSSKFIDQKKAKLSLGEAKEQYFKAKYNLK